MQYFTQAEVIAAVQDARCISHVVCNLKLPCNSASIYRVRTLLVQYGIETPCKGRKSKHERIERDCPVCGTRFQTQLGIRDEKTTCSCKCANTYFRTKSNGPHYTKICWAYHKRECIVCGEQLIVVAHHHNSNHDDNCPENFIPLCPTHHQYWHSRHRHLIEEVVNDYVRNFKFRQTREVDKP
jgi:hypothetical protein